MKISDYKSVTPPSQWLLKTKEVPLAPAEVVSKLNRTDLPDEFIQHVSQYDHTEISGDGDIIHIYDLRDAILINDDPSYVSFLPDMFFFGDNLGGMFYAFDPGNKWGKGYNAIFLIPMGSLRRDDAHFLAENFENLFRQIDAGISFYNLPTLREEE